MAELSFKLITKFNESSQYDDIVAVGDVMFYYSTNIYIYY